MKKIALIGKYGEGLETLVDDEDIWKLQKYRWHLTYEGYVYGWVDGRLVSLARLLMGEPKGLIVDHIDKNKLNNQKANLRICSVYENALNQPNHRKNKHGYIGVSERKERKNKPWVAHITHKRKLLTIGYFETVEEAARARDQKAKELFGEHAVLNFV